MLLIKEEKLRDVFDLQNDKSMVRNKKKTFLTKINSIILKKLRLAEKDFFRESSMFKPCISSNCFYLMLLVLLKLL